jgi:hypothetical protein
VNDWDFYECSFCDGKGHVSDGDTGDTCSRCDGTGKRPDVAEQALADAIRETLPSAAALVPSLEEIRQTPVSPLTAQAIAALDRAEAEYKANLAERAAQRALQGRDEHAVAKRRRALLMTRIPTMNAVELLVYLVEEEGAEALVDHEFGGYDAEIVRAVDARVDALKAAR